MSHKKNTVTALLFFVVLASVPEQPVAAEEPNLEATTAVMAERYVEGMRRIVRQRLSDVGLSESDAERVSKELSDTIEECLSLTMDTQKNGNPAEARIAEDYMQQCVRVAFENAGISYPE